MKILSCHIENYGKITNADFDFSDGLTTVLQENGYGKTTLASFISAMFYGLPSYKENSVDKGDRLRYFPFGGGAFGGNLVFSKDGAEYKIERFFAEKSQSGDELRVFRNGSRTNDFGEDIGKSLFGIDGQSFARTVFFNSDYSEISSTVGINEKLGNYFLGDGEIGFDKARESLEKASLNYQGKKRGVGLIPEIKKRINDIDDQINNLLKISEGLESKYREAERLRAETAELQEKQKRSSAFRVELNSWERYDSYLSSAAEKDGQAAEILEKYPKGLPTESEFISLDNAAGSLKSIEASRKVVVFGEDKKSRLSQLDKVFGGGEPTEEEIESARKAAQEYSKLSAAVSAEEKGQDSSSVRALKERFSRGVPDSVSLAKARQNAESLRSAAPAARPAVKVKTTPYIIIAAVAALLAIVGAALIFVVKTVGIIALVLGAVALVADGFLYIFKRLGAVSAPAVSDGATLSAERDLRLFLSAYGYEGEVALSDFAIFEKELSDYEKYLEERSKAEEKLNADRAERDKNSDIVKNFVIKYFHEEQPTAGAVEKVASALRDRRTLLDESNAESQRTAKLNAEEEGYKREIQTVFSKYGVTQIDELTKDINRLKECARTLSEAKKDADEYRQKAEEYKKQKNLVERPSASDAEDYSEEIEKNALKVADSNRSIAEDENQTEELPSKQAEREEALKKLRDYETKRRLLTAALEALKTAKRNLDEKYISPVRSSFIGYAEKIEKVFGEKISMDNNFSVSFERFGKQRSDEHLSAGERCVCALCLRLALIDNMYGNEKPFLILDDPFVHLDKLHMSRVSEVIKALADGVQIIYFTCHESRKI